MKMKVVVSLIAAGLCLTASAGIRPSFNPEGLAIAATDVVLVTQGEKLDGNCTVVEAWKGDLKPGDKIAVAQLAEFTPETNRIIGEELLEAGVEPFRGNGTRVILSPLPDEPRNAPTHVSGRRMCLFLKREGRDPDRWAGESLALCMAWIEQDRAYAFYQEQNPGPTLLRPLPAFSGNSAKWTEKDLKTNVAAFLALNKTAGILDPAERANALKEFVSPHDTVVTEAALRELDKLGPAAVPVLRSMLNDQKCWKYLYGVISSLKRLDGAEVGGELTQVVEAETQYWKKAGPNLKQGWSNGLWNQSNELSDHWSRVNAALYELKDLIYPGCRKAVTDLRDFWRSLPQLEDPSVANQVSTKCDDILKALQ